MRLLAQSHPWLTTAQSMHMLTMRGTPYQQYAREGLTAYLKGSLASKPGLAEKSQFSVLLIPVPAWC